VKMPKHFPDFGARGKIRPRAQTRAGGQTFPRAPRLSNRSRPVKDFHKARSTRAGADLCRGEGFGR
ncbi:MAG: hypothetical protein ACLR7M_06025, partial [Varibaculum timonense]